MSLSHRKRPAENNDSIAPVRRRSKRTPKPRDYFLQEKEISRGLFEITTDQGRGMNQPGSCLTMNEQDKQDKMKRDEGVAVWYKCLKPAGWVTKQSTELELDKQWLFYAPNPNNFPLDMNVNAFDSYQAIYEHYKKDGYTVEHILARAAQNNETAVPALKTCNNATAARRAGSVTNGSGNDNGNGNNNVSVARDGNIRVKHKQDNNKNNESVCDNSATTPTADVSDFSSDGDGKSEEGSEPVIAAVKLEDATTGGAAGLYHDVGGGTENENAIGNFGKDSELPEDKDPNASFAIKPAEDVAAPAMDNNDNNNVDNRQQAHVAAVKTEEDADEPLIIDLSDDAPLPPSSPPPRPMSFAKRLRQLEKRFGLKATSDVLIDRLEVLEMQNRVVPQSKVLPERLKVLEEIAGLLPVSA